MVRYDEILLFVICFLFHIGCQSQNIISLSGDWQFQSDPTDVGIDQQWYKRDFVETIQLPGSMVENGKGEKITLHTRWTGGIRNPEWYKDPNYAPYLDTSNVRFPFWLQPELKYTGAAWYKKEIVIPQNWGGKTVLLTMERPHWESRVWVNGEEIGMQNSLATPHIYRISGGLKSGKNSIVVRVDNRVKDIDVGENSHSISDHTQSNWNGIVGELSLTVQDDIVFENVSLFPDIENKSVEILAEITSFLDEDVEIKISGNAHLKGGGLIGEKEWSFEISQGTNEIKMIYEMGEDALLWDEFNPNVYQLNLALRHKEIAASTSVDFGLRDFKVDNGGLSVNGRPVFLRGTLECAIFPLTGYPPTQTDYWVKIFTAVQNHGLNHVRFHSWCPPKAAFVAADSMGVYLQVECSSWANQSTQLGSGYPVDEYVWEESRRIIEAYGNHPSFVMMAYGNEPGGPHYTSYLKDFVSYWTEIDNRRVYTGGAGWPVVEENQYHNIPSPRIQAWGEELKSIINSQPPRTDYDWEEKLPDDGIPVVSHEIGQWCVYPNFREIEKYTGVLKPKNFEIFQESLEAHGLGHLADSFLLASGKLQALCYKADIEAALRTPGFGGFQLLDLHDFPGQGTALVGVLDAFWEGKGYITPEEYSRFCNSTVPLVRLKKHIFSEGERMTAGAEIAHFGENALEGVEPSWSLKEDGEIIARGVFGKKDISLGNGIDLGTIEYEFEKEGRPRKLTLALEVAGFENSWDLWVYPEEANEDTDDIRIVENIDETTIKYLEKGGKVLLSLGKGRVAPEMGGDVGLGFSSIFWNTAWTDNQKPHTLGILCNPDHPALAQFPTEYHSNWQWWDAIYHGDVIQLDLLPGEVSPIVRVIDDWVTNRSLALLFEVRIGKGSILVSGTNLVNEMSSRPETRQLKNSLLAYMKSNSFNPEIQWNPEDLRRIIR